MLSLSEDSLIKSDCKDIYNLTKDSILNKCSIHQRMLKNKMHHGFHKNMKQQHNCFQH